jgi:hypothetical protein
VSSALAALARTQQVRGDLSGDPLAEEIQAVLRADKAAGSKLVLPRYRGDDAEFNDYCAIATAACFFLAGGRDVGYQPMQCTDRFRFESLVAQADRRHPLST